MGMCIVLVTVSMYILVHIFGNDVWESFLGMYLWFQSSIHTGMWTFCFYKIMPNFSKGIVLFSILSCIVQVPFIDPHPLQSLVDILILL